MQQGNGFLELMADGSSNCSLPWDFVVGVAPALWLSVTTCCFTSSVVHG